MYSRAKILNRPFRAARREAWSFIGRCSGNVAIIFALSLVPVAGAAAFAIDYGNAYRIRQQMQDAADAAVLSAGSQGIADTEQLTALTRNFFAANGGKTSALRNFSVIVTTPENGVKIRVSGELKTTLSPILSQDDLVISVVSEAGLAGGEMEIALVLDNTGSMRSNMGDLKDAAKDLVNVIYDSTSTPDNIRFAVVPYTGTVNIGTDANQMDWMDVAGDAQHHAKWLEYYNIGHEPGCVDPGSGGGTPDPGPGGGLGGSDRSGLLDHLKRFANGAKELIGIKSAKAANATDVPAPFRFDAPCDSENPARLNLFSLFDLIPNVAWKGCVEARAEPYDVNDTPPDAGQPRYLVRAVLLA